MKIKDLLKFDPEADITLTLNDGFGGSTSFDPTNCRYFTFCGTIEKDQEKHVELVFSVTPQKPKKRQRAVGVP